MNYRLPATLATLCITLAAAGSGSATSSVESIDATMQDALQIDPLDAAGRRPMIQRGSSRKVDSPHGGGSSDWHALGPFGGDVTDVAASTTARGIVLAGIAPGGGGNGGTLYRSMDSGGSWMPVAGLAATSVHDIEFNAAGKAFIGTENGVWSSDDDGATWIRHELGVGPGQTVLDIGLDPSNADIIWAGIADAFGGQPANLLKSADGGQTWTDLTPPHPAPMSGTGIAVAPDDSQTVVAIFGGAFGGGEVWTTINGGATWTNRSTGLPNNPLRAVHYDGTRLLVGGGQAYASQYLGLYGSTNLGQSWSRLDTAAWPLRVVTDIAVDPADSRKIIVAVDGAGLNRSNDGGTSWQTGIGGSAALAAQSVRFAPGDSSELWIGATSLGVYHSGDAGGSLAPSSRGIAELSLFAIDTSPVDPGKLAVAFQGNNSGGVFTSSDGGVTWLTEPTPPTRYSNVRFAPDGTLYALSSGPSTVAPEGLYRRNSNGSWSALGPDQGPLFESDLAAIRFDDSNPSLIYLGGADYGVAGNESTVWRSTDAGATWSKQFEGSTAGEKVSDIDIVPGSGGQSLVAVYDGYDGAQLGGALRSADGGQTWQLALGGLPSFARFPRLCISPATPDKIFMSMWDTWGTGAVYRSDNQGASWTALGWRGGNVSDIACDADDGSVLYVADSSSNTVMHSADQGRTFSRFSNGLGMAGTPTALALSRSGTPLLYMSSTRGSHVTLRDGPSGDTLFTNGFD